MGGRGIGPHCPPPLSWTMSPLMLMRCLRHFRSFSAAILARAGSGSRSEALVLSAEGRRGISPRPPPVPPPRHGQALVCPLCLSLLFCCVQYLSSSVRLISLSIVPSRSTRGAVNEKISFFLWLSNIPLGVCMRAYIHSLCSFIC